jgi:hypothetical protein
MAVTQNKAVSAQALKPVSAVTTAAKTTYNDSANAVKLASAGTAGSILYGLKALARATVTATKLQLYRSPDNGVTMYLIATVTMAAYTMTSTDNQSATDFGYGETVPLRLAIGDTLWVGQSVALASGISWDAQIEDL